MHFIYRLPWGGLKFFVCSRVIELFLHITDHISMTPPLGVLNDCSLKRSWSGIGSMTLFIYKALCLDQSLLQDPFAYNGLVVDTVYLFIRT